MAIGIIDRLLDPALHESVLQVVGLSPFFEQLLEQNPELSVNGLSGCNDFLSAVELNERYLTFVEDRADEPLGETLRKLRRREMIRIVYRDLARKADLAGTTGELSHLADFCIGTALSLCMAQAVDKYGRPTQPNGQPENMVILGMGKLGAFELNLSSDVDLIFLYSHQGEIALDNGKTLSHQEFFLRLARQVIACLDSTDSIDKVFRVDMRLRPYGDSGQLVIHRAAMEKYYLEQGRDWERYAFIKARVIAGDKVAGADFLDWMKPFIYRRNLDYGAVASLREMKGLIARQVELQETNHDLKLGPGGIREVEFIAQAHQLIWGGRYPELQRPELLPVLELLRTLEFIPTADIDALRDAYVFLRNSEHVIQAEYDKQTHRLPEAIESRERLAHAMAYKEYATFLSDLDFHRSEVSRCFEQLVNSTGTQQGEDYGDVLEAEWISPVSEAVRELKAQATDQELGDEVWKTLDTLMPHLLGMITRSANPELATISMCSIVKAILRRSTYLVFLIENPDAANRALELAVLSPWMAEQLSSYPILLYELTDRAIHEVAVSRGQLEGELRETMRAVEIGDLETQMDTLRQFKLSATLKIAAMELLGEISIMQASDGLTALAEVILESCIDLAWLYLEGRHGVPCDDDNAPLTERIAIIAYGKAGGLELAYGSDLDLVFLSPNHISGNTDGVRSINNNMFFVRLGQRIIHILASFTRFGILYSIDMRLRPQGNNGPLVATIGAFDRYQTKDAWTWEHQALIRARFVAGDTQLGEDFANIRQQILSSERDKNKLLADVLMMREKMRQHLSSLDNASLDKKAEQAPAEDGSEILRKFDLKHDVGAIVDIEFMVQYAVLAAACRHPSLGRWTDVMRLLDELEQSGEFLEEETQSLQRAYLSFRAAVHHGWLGLETDFERLSAYREEVHSIWGKRMLSKPALRKE
jgi:glutamate-ammonia-ligase adenylyltransferase